MAWYALVLANSGCLEGMYFIFLARRRRDAEANCVSTGNRISVHECSSVVEIGPPACPNEKVLQGSQAFMIVVEKVFGSQPVFAQGKKDR